MHTFTETPISSLLQKMADDSLIIGHRNSEWTGLGPTLEEDIAFSSMAQDKIGHAWALYQILETEFSYPNPDNFGFTRSADNFTCCHFVELPIGEYDFSLMRQFLFDHAEYLRYSALKNSSFEPLAKLANKITGEIRYHILHADTWIKSLALKSESARLRLQGALDYAFPYALGIFEIAKANYEQQLIDNEVFIGEKALKKMWLQEVQKVLTAANLHMPDYENVQLQLGGRQGFHTDYLAPLLSEMTEVYSLDNTAEW